MPAEPPKGYKTVYLYSSGSNVTHVVTLMCLKCGMFVGDFLLHNKFHDDLMAPFRPIVLNYDLTDETPGDLVAKIKEEIAKGIGPMTLGEEMTVTARDEEENPDV
jgi:hypothetical protein